MSDAKPDAKAIFLEALECKGAFELMRFLDQACGASAVLRGRVEELLRAHQNAGAFLGGAEQQEATRDQPIVEHPGTIIGPYKLLEQIGEGGFGVVFMAEQTQPVRRKVALKVLKPGMDTRQVVARFEAERQALAIMDHPHIAKVLDGGATETGRPYFVMELVRGVPITEFCDQNLLTPRQRLELFIPVCQAIQHAHQKGIIHRDLKPSNVLVSRHDTTPVVKVIDFGVAKALGQVLTDKTLFTGIAQMIGTPLYMSPEQAGMSDLDIDTRSDIYSLGVLLYELLTGATPFDEARFTQAAQDDIRRIIREEEPPRPSTRLSDSKETLPSISALRGMEPAKLTKLVRGELDWIVMKALEKDRNRRYETANSIAADIERYLKDEPVQACPPSAGYRIRKFVSRNRAPLFTTAAIGLATLVLFAAMAWSAWDRHSRSIQRANEKSARAAVLSARLPDILSDITRLEEQQAWPEALAAAHRAETAVEVGEGDAEITATVRGHVAELQFVERLEAARSIRDVDSGDSIYDKMGRPSAPGIASAHSVDAGPANFDGIERAYNEAFAAFGVDLNNPSTAATRTRLRQAPGILQAVAAALDDWAAVRRNKAHPGARHLSELALALDDDPFRRAIRQAILSQSVETLRRLAKELPKTPQPAATLWLIGIAQSTTDERVQLLMHAQVEYPADFWINFHLGLYLINARPPLQDDGARFLQAALALRPSSRVRGYFGRVLVRLNRREEAEAVIRKGLSLNPRDASNYWALSDLCRWRGQLQAALKADRSAVALDPGFADAHLDMGLDLYLLGRFDEAIEACRKALEIDPTYPWGRVTIGAALRGKKQYRESLAVFEMARRSDPNNPVLAREIGATIHAQNGQDGLIAYWRREMELNPKDWRSPLYLGMALARKGQVDEGLVSLEKSISLTPTDPTELAVAYSDFGWILTDKGRFDDAIVSFRKSIEIRPRYELKPDALVWAYKGIGDALTRQAKLDAAVAAYRKCIEIEPTFVWGYLQSIWTLQEQGKQQEANILLGKAHALDPADPQHRNVLAWHFVTGLPKELREPALGVKLARGAVELEPGVGTYWNTLGVAHYRAGDWNAAIAALQKSMELGKGGDSFDWFFLAMAYEKLGDTQKARQWYERATVWMEKNQAKNEELGRFKAEAAELLGVEGRKK